MARRVPPRKVNTFSYIFASKKRTTSLKSQNGLDVRLATNAFAYLASEYFETTRLLKRNVCEYIRHIHAIPYSHPLQPKQVSVKCLPLHSLHWMKVVV